MLILISILFGACAGGAGALTWANAREKKIKADAKAEMIHYADARVELACDQKNRALKVYEAELREMKQGRAIAEGKLMEAKMELRDLKKEARK